MKINLYTSFKRDVDENRNKEKIHCLTRNLQCGFNRIHLVCETLEDKNYFEEQVYDKLFSSVGNFYAVTFQKKVTFNDFFDLIGGYKSQSDEDTLNVICNPDIYFNSLQPIDIFYEDLDLKRSTILALSRWYYEKYDKFVHYNREDSQDSWMIYGYHQIKLNEEISFDCIGSDNRIAHELTNLGYRLINPSSIIKPIQLDNSKKTEKKKLVEPPYLYVTPY
jgi:hypothetical protein